MALSSLVKLHFYIATLWSCSTSRTIRGEKKLMWIYSDDSSFSAVYIQCILIIKVLLNQQSCDSELTNATELVLRNYSRNFPPTWKQWNKKSVLAILVFWTHKKREKFLLDYTHSICKWYLVWQKGSQCCSPLPWPVKKSETARLS